MKTGLENDTHPGIVYVPVSPSKDVVKDPA